MPGLGLSLNAAPPLPSPASYLLPPTYIDSDLGIAVHVHPVFLEPVSFIFLTF